MKKILKNIFKYRLSSFLTLISLVIAFLGIIVLTLYVSYERSFDMFHKNKDNIYLMSFNTGGGSSLPAPMDELIKANVPEIEKSFIMWGWGNNEFCRTDQTRKDAVVYNSMSVSNEFFTMFDFPLLAGNSQTALSKPKSIVLSEKMAKNIFGTIDVVGKPLLASGMELNITGVMKDMPNNTSFKQDAFVSLIPEEMNDWSEWGFSIFFQLKKGTDKVAVTKKIENIERVAEILKQIAERYSPEAAAVVLIPVSKIHYGSHNNMNPSVNKTVLNVLSVLIVVLLIMGAVNFINFSTSQAPLPC